MRKKAIVSLLVISAVIITLTGVTLAIDGWPDFFKIGQQRNDRDDVVAYVDGEPIYKSSLEQYSLFRQETSPQYISDSENLDYLIREQVKYNKAVKLGLLVSYEETKRRRDEILETVMELTRSNDQSERDSAITALENRENYRKGTGCTEEEYVEKYEIPSYQREFTKQALFTYFKSTLAEYELTNGKDVMEKYNKYIDELVNQARIEYCND